MPDPAAKDLIVPVATLLGGGVSGAAVKALLERRNSDKTADAALLSADAQQAQGLVAIINAQRGELNAAAEQRRELLTELSQLRNRMDEDAIARRAEAQEHEHEMQRVHAKMTALITQVDNNAAALATQDEQHTRQMAIKNQEIRELKQEVAGLRRDLANRDQQLTALKQQVESAGAHLAGGAA